MFNVPCSTLDVPCSMFDVLVLSKKAFGLA